MRKTVDAPRVLLVVGEEQEGIELSDLVQSADMQAVVVKSATAALQQASSIPPFDMILLSTTPAGRSGAEVLSDLRRASIRTPVIMLANSILTEDKIRCFAAGADDYVSRPYNKLELLMRIKAVLKRAARSGNVASEVYVFGKVQVDLKNHSATVEEHEVQFTTLEFDILKYFINHKGRTVSRKQLLRDVWGISGEITTRTIDRHVASLRKKIERDPDSPEHIETVYGIGYKFSD